MHNQSVLSISYNPGIFDSASETHLRHQFLAQNFTHFTVADLSSVSRIPKTNSPLHLYGLKKSQLLSWYRVLLKLHQHFQFDVVTSQDPLYTGLIAWLVAKKIGLPFVLQLHSTYHLQSGWLREHPGNNLKKHLVNFLLTQADAIRVVNPLIIPAIQELTKKSNTPVVHIPITINPRDWLSPIRPKPSLTKLIAVGRLAPEKNFKSLIKAVQIVRTELPNLELTIVGDGQLRPQLTKLIKALSLEKTVCLTGQLSKKDLLKQFQQHDIFIGVSQYEGWFLAAHEASLAGLPIITTRVGSAEFLFKHDQSAIFTNPDSQSIAKSILYVVKSSKHSLQIARKGQETIKDYYQKHDFNAQYIQLLRNATRNQRA